MIKDQQYPIENADGDRGTDIRGPGDDPHGEMENLSRRYPDPDPLEEMATIDDAGGRQPPRLASQMGPKPGFGPDEFTPPLLEGDSDLGLDPRAVASVTGDGR